MARRSGSTDALGPAESLAEWIQAHKPPLRIQFALAFGVAALLVILLIKFVDYANPRGGAESPVTSEKELAAEAHDGDIVVGQDEAPHVVRLASGAQPDVAVRAAILAYMHAKVAGGQIAGPVTAASCATTSGSSPNRIAYHCTVVSGSVSYPFDGIVEPSTRTLTYCKVDYAPQAGESVPISARCR